MTPDLRAFLLAHPLDYATDALKPEYRHHHPQVDGALLTVILAVDR